MSHSESTDKESPLIENFHEIHQKSLAFVFFEEYIHAGSGT